jgi:hypothetical protein
VLDLRDFPRIGDRSLTSLAVLLSESGRFSITSWTRIYQLLTCSMGVSDITDPSTRSRLAAGSPRRKGLGLFNNRKTDNLPIRISESLELDALLGIILS